MLYHSLTDARITRDFAQAVVEGLAPDKGLYFPERIPSLPESLWLSDEDMEPWELGAAMMAPLAEGTLTHDALVDILRDVLNFPLELHEIKDNVYALELFHGPTHAFKDVGARFLSRVLRSVSDQRLTILVATSGDTGSAVAQGFLNVPNIDVVILYPKGRISRIQEQQLTTAGANIQALEVEGAFDDCQAMVKAAFLDADLQAQRPLTSANSINIARWMPQSIYYAWATHLLGQPVQFSVPSGNVGNLAAGVLAAQMGMPHAGFVAATNDNRGLAAFLNGEAFEARPSVATLSNAMDVGDPSNRPRLEALYGRPGRVADGGPRRELGRRGHAQGHERGGRPNGLRDVSPHGRGVRRSDGPQKDRRAWGRARDSASCQVWRSGGVRHWSVPGIAVTFGAMPVQDQGSNRHSGHLRGPQGSLVAVIHRFLPQAFPTDARGDVVFLQRPSSCGAVFAAVEDDLQVQLVPALLREKTLRVALRLLHRFAIGEVPAVHQAVDVGVDGERRHPKP